MAKELVPIVISCAVWGSILQESSTEFHCDNQGLVAAINKGSSKDTMVIYLLRCLWFFTAAFDINITATHISGKSNNAADMLSRNQAAKFLETHPDIPAFPTPLPPSILHLVTPHAETGLDLPNIPQIVQKDLSTRSTIPQTPITV